MPRASSNEKLLKRIETLEAKLQRYQETETALLEVEEKYRSLIETIDEGYFEVDLKGNFTFFNAASCRMLGYAPEELLGMNYRVFSLPETARKMFRTFNQVYETGGPGTLTDYIIATKSGEKRYLELSAYLIRDRDGEPTGFRGICRDITQRKADERALRESEERFRRLHEASFGGILIHDSGIIIDANQGLSDMTGYSLEELVGMDASKLIAPAWQDLVREKVDAGYERPYDAEGIRRDGTIYPIEIHGRSIPYQGRRIRLVEIRDITERKHTEKALRESEQRFRQLYDQSKRAEEIYRSLLNSSADAIVIYDMNMRVQYVSPSFTQIFGWTLPELKGKPIPYIPENQAKHFRDFTRELIEKGMPYHGVESKRFTKDGREIDVNLSASRYLDHEGRPAGILVIIRDVSEAIKLTRQLNHAQKMESVGTLAGGIAHDFNNLLMALQGRISLMMMEMDSRSRYWEHVKGMEEYVKRAADLTKQLLGFARSGKYEVRPTNLNQLIQDQNRMFARTKKEITIHEKYDPCLDTVNVDCNQIEQVLLNLYVNAWQAMPDGGDLFVSTHGIDLEAAYTETFGCRPGRYIKVTVTDTGIGMESAVRERIFEPFFTTKEMGRGTGLGLASAYGIIKNHGGFINVYSEKGKGTTFSIYLPVSSQPAVREKVAREKITKGEGTILLIDDEEMILEIGSQMLASLGYQVLQSCSGQEAVEMYRQKSAEIHLVILDMIMPKMGGGETFDRLKQINPDLKVILASGYSLNGQAASILHRGCNSFIQKPFSLLELSRKIREVMEKSA